MEGNRGRKRPPARYNKKRVAIVVGAGLGIILVILLIVLLLVSLVFGSKDKDAEVASQTITGVEVLEEGEKQDRKSVV